MSYPVAYGLKAKEFSEQTGAFYSAAKEYVHATGFIINAGGEVVEAVYSTGPIGRLTAQDTLALLESLNKKEDEK